MAIGAWQDVFTLIYLEEQPMDTNFNTLLYSDDEIKLVATEARFLVLNNELTLASIDLCRRTDMAF
jgi:hypothetical protein